MSKPRHLSGKQKARVFASILGITLEKPDVLRELIQTAAVAGEVVQQSTTQFGQNNSKLLIPTDKSAGSETVAPVQ
ncbi:MAG: DUF6883 domain-containing protein [Nostoc sp.]|uniref:DUF6883 domain-containing protein n=1 Tax=Nostoc sp. TaxID=1180 RepID=UPI002FFC3CF1